MSRRAPSPPPKPSSSTARTVVLVAVVAAIAALVLSRGFGGSSSKSSTGSDGSTTKTTVKKSGGTTAAETVATLAPTTLPPIAPAAVKVVVLNGNGIQGTAGKRKDELIKLGYTQTTADDASTKDFTATAIYYLSAEYKDAANAIAAKMGLTASPPPPADKPYVDPAKIAAINVVVLLGKDKAQTPITNGAAPTTAGVATTVPLTAAKATSTTKKP